MDLSRLNPLAHIRSVNRYWFFSHATFIPFCFYFFFNVQIGRAVRDLYISVHSCKRVLCNVKRAYANTVFFYGGKNCLIEPFAAYTTVKIHMDVFIFPL